MGVSLVSLGTDILQNVFIYLTVGQMARSCSTINTFNLVCKRESLWKSKLWNDYTLDCKVKNTWREEIKTVYLDSEKFWNGLNESIDSEKFWNGLNESIDFDIVFVRSLREKEEFYVAEMIFKLFYVESIRYMKSSNGIVNTSRSLDIESYKTFNMLVTNILYQDNTPNFTSRKKLSSTLKLLSVRKILKEGKLSLRWILDLNPIKEVKICSNIDLTPGEYSAKWTTLNTNLHSSLVILSSLYGKNRRLFVNDTTEDQKMIVTILRYYG